MNPENDSFQVLAGVLPDVTFRTEQERFEAFAAALSVKAATGKLGSKGDKGEKGDSWTRETKYIAIASGATTTQAPDDVDLEGAGPVLVCAGTPTIYILGVKKNVVFLSAAAPDGNSYKVAYSVWTKS